jgi:hypothetical protein
MIDWIKKFLKFKKRFLEWKEIPKGSEFDVLEHTGAGDIELEDPPEIVQVSTPKADAPTEPIAKVTEPVAAPVDDKSKEVNENRNKLIDEDSLVGDSVLRNILGAEPIEGN